MNTFSEFFIERQKNDVTFFLESNHQQFEDSKELFYNMICKFGNDPIILEAWGDWWNKAKEYAGKAWNWANNKDMSLQDIATGTGNLAKGVVTGYKQGYKATEGEAGIKKIESIAKEVSELAKSFSQKYKVDPVTAAVLISAGATGGLGAISMIAIAIGLRRSGSWLADKGFEKVWEKLTGMTVDQADAAWQGSSASAPKMASPASAPKMANPASAPKMAGSAGTFNVMNPSVSSASIKDHFQNSGNLTFEQYIMSRDPEMYMELTSWLKQLVGKGAKKAGEFAGNVAQGAKDYAKDVGERGFGTATGERAGRVLGKGAGTFVNIWSVLKKSIANVGKFMANNPVKTSKLVLAIAAGSMIGHYGTQAINNFIHKPSSDQIGEITKAAKDSGVSRTDINDIHKDTGYTSPDAGEYIPPDGTQTYYANRDTNWKTMPTVGSPEDIAFKKSFLPHGADTTYSGGGGDFGNAIGAKISYGNAVAQAKADIVQSIRDGNITDYETLQKAIKDAHNKFFPLLDPIGKKVFDSRLDMHITNLAGNGAIGNGAELATKIITNAGGTPNMEILSNLGKAFKDNAAARSIPLWQDNDVLRTPMAHDLSDLYYANGKWLK